MGEKTGISWTDHTFNAWIGCAKVSQGCILCYAETQNKRYNWTGGGWGPGAPRQRTSAANWKKPLEWARKARADGVTRRVFCASLADVFDAEVAQEWRIDLWNLIENTGYTGGLEWLILTKRPENIKSMLPNHWLNYPPGFVRLGLTGEDHPNFVKRIHELLNVWPGNNFVSYEPAIGPIDLYRAGLQVWDDPINWLICGGESGAGCRPFDPEWARKVMHQCKADGIPFFMKQLGGHPNKRHDPAEWPEDLRVQEVPV